MRYQTYMEISSTDVGLNQRHGSITIRNERKAKQARTWKKKYGKLGSYLSEGNRKKKPPETKEEKEENDNEAATAK